MADVDYKNFDKWDNDINYLGLMFCLHSNMCDCDLTDKETTINEALDNLILVGE